MNITLGKVTKINIKIKNKESLEFQCFKKVLGIEKQEESIAVFIDLINK